MVWNRRFSCVEEKDFTATAECHDSVLGGEFSLDVLHKSVEYAKRFDLGGAAQGELNSFDPPA